MAALAAPFVKSVPPVNRSSSCRNSSSKHLVVMSSMSTPTRRGAMGMLLGSLVWHEACARAETSPCEEYNKMPSGLEVCEVVTGAGQAPVPGNVIKLHYKGTLENGLVFDSSYDRGEPLTFQLRPNQVLMGVYEAVLGIQGLLEPMRPGGKRRVRLPPDLGFGDSPGQCPRFSTAPCLVPPNSVLVYDLEYINLYGR